MTYLKSDIKGIFYYLYLIIDLYSRKIIHWEVYQEQTAENASEFIKKAKRKEQLLSTDLLVLHSDNGGPMKGAVMLETLYKLGITPSRSRPRVSNDNAYAESIFKTLKYRPNYQPDGFENIDNARAWVFSFEQWYNLKHRHSGIKYLTPHQRHNGEGQAILEARKAVYEKAKAKFPERWKGHTTRNWEIEDMVYLNPCSVKERKNVA
ncbi:MAG: integrase core domain-containing protein [Eubacteriales bacterium]